MKENKDQNKKQDKDFAKKFFDKIPKEVILICEKIQKNNFESYLVGGCVRDLIMGREPNDYDVTTNAKPEEIIKIFGEDDTVYENKFGTVGVKIRDIRFKMQDSRYKIQDARLWIQKNTETYFSKEREGFQNANTVPQTPEGGFTQNATEIVEVTTFRKEGDYQDFRRPNKVEWGKSIEEDLMRRDFTINAVAYDPIKDILIDPYKGQNDIKDKIINCVGDSEERFNEDALRMLRAVRFSAQLEFIIGSSTMSAIFKLSKNLEKISHERIRDEFVKIILTKDPMTALVMSQKLGVLKYISPELEKGIGIDQNQAHKYDVFEHNLRTLQHASDKDWPLHVRLAGLFHDISKPETRRWSKEKNDWTFYGHDVVGARVAKEILSRLKFEKEIIETVTLMVRWHMFFSDTEKITLSAVRRLISNVGKERVWDLMDLRVCDRIGTGRPKENPYRLRVYKSMVAEAMTDPVSLKMLKTNGEKIMSLINEKPSKKIGYILHALFNEVLENPEKNNEEYLSHRTKELSFMNEEDVKKLSEEGKDKMEEENFKNLKAIKEEFHVKMESDNE